MAAINLSHFQQFIKQRRNDLLRIARKTGGEYQLSDVVNEAWLMADYIEARKGIISDFINPEFQDLLLSYVYRALVSFDEKNVRFGIRIDHSARNGDEEDAPHPLQLKLSAIESQTPINLLLSEEDMDDHEAAIANSPSIASAYVRLLRHCDNRMQAVADHLLISLSHAYRCCAKARRLELTQQHLDWVAPDNAALPSPWRRFRLQRTTTVCSATRQVSFLIPLEPISVERDRQHSL